MDRVAALAITDSAGSPNSSTSYVDLLTPVTDWATTNQKRLFLSGLGVANGAPNGEVALGNLLEYLNDDSNVWIGWTTWNLPPYNISQLGKYTADGPERPGTRLT